MKEFKVDDRVYCLVHGEGKVTAVNNKSDHPITVQFFTVKSIVHYLSTGKFSSDTSKVLYHLDEEPQVVTNNPQQVPTITNAMQAIDLLDKGKRIVSDTFYDGEVYCFKDELGNVLCHDINTGLVNRTRMVRLYNIFTNSWYEHKQQHNCGFIQALKVFKKGYTVKLNDCTLRLDYGDEFILVNRKGQRVPISNEHLTSNDWETIIE